MQARLDWIRLDLQQVDFVVVILRTGVPERDDNKYCGKIDR